jgi:hypothetical protein
MTLFPKVCGFINAIQSLIAGFQKKCASNGGVDGPDDLMGAVTPEPSSANSTRSDAATTSIRSGRSGLGALSLRLFVFRLGLLHDVSDRQPLV